MSNPMPTNTVWTKHAIDRTKETPIKVSFMKKLFKSASLMQLKKYIEAWKFAKYGMKQCNIVYYKKKLEVIYTINQTDNTVITVTVKEENGNTYGKEL